MIRVKRAAGRLPLTRRYTVEFAPNADSEPHERQTLGRSAAVKRLEREVGIGDAWSFIHAADDAWNLEPADWAVEFEERPHP
jgi:hypothetical protein